MVELYADNKTFSHTMTLTTKQLTDNKEYIKDRQAHWLAEPAVETMRFGVQKYWSRTYSLSRGNTRQLNLFGGTSVDSSDFRWAKKKERYKGQRTLVPVDKSKFRGRSGKRMVSFSFEMPKRGDNIFQSSLKIHSFPMNLYERDVRLGGWARRVMKNPLRKGTHIMRGFLPSEAEKQMQIAGAKFDAELKVYFKSRGQS